jgi:hypothetical protein
VEKENRVAIGGNRRLQVPGSQRNSVMGGNGDVGRSLKHFWRRRRGDAACGVKRVFGDKSSGEQRKDRIDRQRDDDEFGEALHRILRYALEWPVSSLPRQPMNGRFLGFAR